MAYGHGVKYPSYRKRTAYHAMLLGGIAALASSLLVVGDIATRDTIALRHAETLRATLAQVIPGELHDNDLLADTLTLPSPRAGTRPLTIYRAVHEGEVSAVAFQVVGMGYAGPIVSLLAVDAEGQVLGVRVLQHTETPGLGDKIEIQRDPWILDFNGLSLLNTPAARWAVKKDGGQFDQFTGATITPRAVVESVQAGLSWFDSQRNSLLAPPAPREMEISP